uniref:Uncharacterized protein n=1 Tax=Candidatus Kentrum sp. SD TaxID=2126332 RepID=A0A450YRA0_9GAMM|nr:MAG: hypothetical protein BECKSD772E_GA0070983_10327 [Candidatus Kentron sp. SD]
MRARTRTIDLKYTGDGTDRKMDFGGRISRVALEHKSERFAFGYVLYWLARSNRLQTGCSLRGRRVFQNLYFSDT